MKDRLYFNNLNGLRFIAALMVIISHLELNKSYFSLENYFQDIKELGRLGVSLFFVLSGFLITYLLVREKEKNGVIGIKNFYMRRIYRIWPLYYFIVLLSLFVLPHITLFSIPNLKLEIDSSTQFITVIILLVFFLTNVLVHIKLIPFATQTWSIGTEEQFYLIWPLLINKIKNLAPLFMSLILLYNLLLIVLSYPFLDTIKYIELFKSFVFSFQLDSLTLGALGAYLFYSKNSIIEFISNIYIFVLTIFCVVLAIIFHVDLGFFKSTFFALLFTIVIINLVNNDKLVNLLENNIFNFLGKISYGLYMYHQIVIVFVINILIKYNITSSFWIYILSILITIIVSSISYQFLEKPFLKRKERITTFNNHK